VLVLLVAQTGGEPPGQTQTPAGSEAPPPGQTQTPAGSEAPPPAQAGTPAGTEAPLPPEQTQTPAGTEAALPPEQPETPIGTETAQPPDQTEAPAAIEAAQETEQQETPVESDIAQQWTGTISENISRPDVLREPIYPSDITIGALGPGTAPMDAYNYARRVLRELRQSNTKELSALSSKDKAEITGNIETVKPASFRIGGGREEEDGSISFLFRFIGKNDEFAGEIYLRDSSGKGDWKVEDVIPEDIKTIQEATDNEHAYSWLPYDRIY